MSESVIVPWWDSDLFEKWYLIELIVEVEEK